MTENMKALKMEIMEKQLDIQEDLSKRIELKANIYDMNERL